MFLLFLNSVYADDFWSFDSSFQPSQALFIYLIPVDNMTNINLTLSANCLNITGGRLNGSRCLLPNIITINFICENNNDCFLPDTCLSTLVCGIDTSPIEITEDIVTLPRTMAVALPVAISVFFLAIAITQGIPIVGVFASIMFMTESWFVASFSPFMGLIMGLLSFVMLIFFVLWRKKIKIN